MTHLDSQSDVSPLAPEADNDNQSDGDSYKNSRPYDVHRSSEHPEVQKIINALFDELKETAAWDNARKNAKLKKHIKAVVLDLYHCHLHTPGRYIGYSRSPNSYKAKSRYNELFIAYRPMMHVVNALEEQEYIEGPCGFNDRYSGIGYQSRMRATDKLIQLIQNSEFTLSMISTSPQEVIILHDSDKKNMEYDDTPETNLMRTKLDAYNEALRSTNITLSPEGVELAEEAGITVDYSRKIVSRVFNNGSFEEGGRFYHPWWQKLNQNKKVNGERVQLRSHILINGNETVELDFSAFHIHLLYSREGLNYHELFGPDDYPYTLPGHDLRSRKVLKTVFLVAINAQDHDQAIYAARNLLRKKMEPHEYEAIDLSTLIVEFQKKHPLIAHHIYSGIGVHLQFTDSKITEYVFDRFMELNTPVLGVHDSFIVEELNEHILEEHMNEGCKYLELSSVPKIDKK